MAVGTYVVTTYSWASRPTHKLRASLKEFGVPGALIQGRLRIDLGLMSALLGAIPPGNLKYSLCCCFYKLGGPCCWCPCHKSSPIWGLD